MGRSGTRMDLVMDKLLRARTVCTRPETSSCGLQTQQGTH
jgi:hypothetical protein